MHTAEIFSEWIRLGRTADWNELVRNRGGFQDEFTRLVGAAAGSGRTVLDIGCGGGFPAALSGLAPQLEVLDGVDPDPQVEKHRRLRRRWHGTFETAAIDAESYDLAYAYNVLEHIAEPRPFFEKMRQVLKPGGVFWALTPNGQHPFALLSRSIELAGLKGLARAKLGSCADGSTRVNDYPAYYRCNSPRAVLRAIHGLGFRRVTFYFHPCLQWDTYFPGCLRWVPRSYDFLVGTRLASCMQIFIVCLEK